MLTVPDDASQPFDCIVLTGEPIDEPMVRYGPFVMNTEAELDEAIADFNAGRMGTIPATGHLTPTAHPSKPQPEKADTMKLLAFAATTSRSRSTATHRLRDPAARRRARRRRRRRDDRPQRLRDADLQHRPSERDGIPELAHDFFDKIGAADAVLISFAEHNGFYTAAYKNIFDWASRIDMRVYQDKPAVLLSHLDRSGRRQQRAQHRRDVRPVLRLRRQGQPLDPELQRQLRHRSRLAQPTTISTISSAPPSPPSRPHTRRSSPA